MRNRVRRLLSGDPKGQGLIEMTLALPVLLIVFLGMIELALLMRAHLVVVNANREAARFAGRGTFTDQQIADRAITSFAGQLPVQMTAPNANTEIVITRCTAPAAQSESATCNDPTSFGVLGRGSQIDRVAYANQLDYEHDQFNKELIDSQPDAVRTMQDVVIVEVYYLHQEALHAPIVNWVFPDPMVVYSRTFMRIGASRVN